MDEKIRQINIRQLTSKIRSINGLLEDYQWELDNLELTDKDRNDIAGSVASAKHEMSIHQRDLDKLQ